MDIYLSAGVSELVALMAAHRPAVGRRLRLSCLDDQEDAARAQAAVPATRKTDAPVTENFDGCT